MSTDDKNTSHLKTMIDYESYPQVARLQVEMFGIIESYESLAAERMQRGSGKVRFRGASGTWSAKRRYFAFAASIIQRDFRFGSFASRYSIGGDGSLPLDSFRARRVRGTEENRNGNYGRRVDARPVSELATLRVHSIKRSANGVSVRSLTVMNPTGVGGDDTLTGRTLRCICLPPKRMTEAGTRPSHRPVSIRRM